MTTNGNRFFADMRQSPLAVLMLLVGLGLSCVAAYYVGSQSEQKARAQFLLHTNDAGDAIVERLGMHVEILRGARGLFAASEAVTRAEWKRYVAALDLRRFPGFQGLGFIRYVAAADKEGFERRMRADASLDPAGRSGYAVFPPGTRADYYPLEYFESTDPDLNVLGLDHGAYDVGREALERARDLDQPQASDRLISIVDRGHKPRFMIVLPVYRNGMAHGSVAERRQALFGFVYARFRLDELFGNSIGSTLLQELYLEIFDGGIKGREIAAPERTHLLYDADWESVPRAVDGDFRPRFSTLKRLEVAGRDWILYFAARADSPLGMRASLHWLVLASGILLSFAVAAVILILTTERRRVEAEVRRQKSLMSQLLDVLPINIFLKDAQGRFIRVNQQCARLFGLSQEEAVGKNDFDVFPPDVARELRAYDDEVRAAGGLVMREEKLVSGGREVVALAGKTMIAIDDSGAALLLGFSIDITERKKIEDDLRESEARLRGILDNSSSVIYAKDLDGCYLLANRAHAALVGIPTAEIVGKSDYDCFPRDLADQYRENDRQVLALGKAIEFEEHTRQGDGRQTYISVKFPLCDVAGKPYAVCGISTDITERLRLEREAAAAKANQLSRAITNAIGEGIIGVDALHRVVFANPKAQELLAVDEAAMLGRRLDDIVRVVTADGCHLTDDTCPAWSCVTTGRTFHSDDWFLTRGDGSLFAASAVIAPIFDGAAFTGAVMSFNDVTQRKTTEEALARAEQQQKAFLDNLPEMAWFKDKDSRYVMMNEPCARAFHLTPAAAVGKTDLDCCPPELAELYRADDRAVMASGERRRVEEPFEGKDGRRFWIETIKSPIYDDKGRVIGTVGTARDITQRKHDEAELKRHIAELARMNAELDEFSYIASHDLQEPLRKMISFSDWLKRDLGDNLPERAAKDLGFIMDAAGRMQALVQDLLALSRTGKTSMVHEWVNLDEVVDRALDVLALRIQESGATIVRDPLPEVQGDPALLAQLYQNLIANALKFVGSEPPHIRLTVEPADQAWMFGVKDNGIGIRPDYAEQIFQPFKRLHGRGEYEGSGIGLAICRKVVERHRGRIWVESEEGRGAHFRFVLARQDGRK